MALFNVAIIYLIIIPYCSWGKFNCIIIDVLISKLL